MQSSLLWGTGHLERPSGMKTSLTAGMWIWVLEKKGIWKQEDLFQGNLFIYECISCKQTMWCATKFWLFVNNIKSFLKYVSSLHLSMSVRDCKFSDNTAPKCRQEHPSPGYLYCYCHGPDGMLGPCRDCNPLTSRSHIHKNRYLHRFVQRVVQICCKPFLQFTACLVSQIWWHSDGPALLVYTWDLHKQSDGFWVSHSSRIVSCFKHCRSPSLADCLYITGRYRFCSAYTVIESSTSTIGYSTLWSAN